MPAVNLLAVVLAALSAFLVGGIWYSPLMFAKPWMAENGFTAEDMAGFNPVKSYTLTLVCTLIAAYTFAMFLGPETYWKRGAAYGFTAGLCWVGMAMATGFIFERRTFKLWMINAGYHTIQFTLIGAIIGAMN
ncbi:MAG: DUF1761 domain-containing protein [Gemmatimonadota bacterium]